MSRQTTMESHTQALPSGKWVACITEGKISRTEHLTLKFGKDGTFSGFHDGGDMQVGFLKGEYTRHDISWDQNYGWGSITATGKINHHAKMDHNAVVSFGAKVEITGTFEATDGGRGTLRLTPSAEE